MLDMTESIDPKSDQLNAEHLLTGPRTVTVTDVQRGSAEQPVNVHLAEFPGLPFRPSKTVRRIMVAAWGIDAATYVGKRMTLWNDPTVLWAGQAVGGIRVTHLSGIKKPLTIALTVTRGKRDPFIVQPLADATILPVNPPEQGGAGIGAEQMKTLVAAMGANGLSAKEAALAFISQTVGRDVAASKELTRVEADQVIDALGVEQ